MTQTPTLSTYVSNPDAAKASNIAARGFRLYVRPHAEGVVNKAGTFKFLGATKGYEPNTDEETREFSANLYGIEETLKKQLAKRTRTFNFYTGSTGDDEIAGLFYGSSAVAGAGDYADVKAMEDTGAATNVDMVVVLEPSEGNSLIGYYPSASLRGTGPGEDDGFQTFEFEAAIQSVPGFEPPAALVNMGKATPQGVLYIVPKEDTEAFLLDLFAAVSA